VWVWHSRLCSGCHPYWVVQVQDAPAICKQTDENLLPCASLPSLGRCAVSVAPPLSPTSHCKCGGCVARVSASPLSAWCARGMGHSAQPLRMSTPPSPWEWRQWRPSSSDTPPCLPESACASTSTSIGESDEQPSRRSSSDERRSQTPTGDAGAVATISTAEAAVAECNAQWKKRRREARDEDPVPSGRALAVPTRGHSPHSKRKLTHR
jgi:hypothetical protein